MRERMAVTVIHLLLAMFAMVMLLVAFRSGIDHRLQQAGIEAAPAKSASLPQSPSPPPKRRD